MQNLKKEKKKKEKKGRQYIKALRMLNTIDCDLTVLVVELHVNAWFLPPLSQLMSTSVMKELSPLLIVLLDMT